MAAASTPSKISALCFIAALLVAVSGNHDQHMAWLVKARSGCRGTVADSLAGSEEFDLDSELHGHIPDNSGYISYGALRRDIIPCSQRGSSYYNCGPGGQANPYHRGCNEITRCRH